MNGIILDRIPRRVIRLSSLAAAVLVLAGLVSPNHGGHAAAAGSAAPMGIWTATSSLDSASCKRLPQPGSASSCTPRYGSASVRLLNGKILVAGGFSDTGSASADPSPATSAELYDPATGTWSPTGPPPHRTNEGDVLVLLLPSGKVLDIHGTSSQVSGPLPTVCVCPDLYDPEAVGSNGVRGTWVTTGPFPDDSPLGTYKPERLGFTANLIQGTPAECGLNCGKVLVVGGRELRTPLSVLYDPNGVDLANTAAGTWRYTAASTVTPPRAGHVAAMLPSSDPALCGSSCGKVMITGGAQTDADCCGFPDIAVTELYNPAAETWEPGGAMAPGTASSHATATVLANGRVLVAGGRICPPALPTQGTVCESTRLANIYDPRTRTWSAAASMKASDPDGGGLYAHHSATRLSSGVVLISGPHGEPNGQPPEVYNPVVNTWSSSEPQRFGYSDVAHFQPDATLITGTAKECGVNCGRVLSAGAVGAGAELYSPPPVVTAIEPAIGPTSGGTGVTITGTGLDSAATTVAFGDPTNPANVLTCGTDPRAPCYSDPSSPDTTIHAVTPAHPAGQVDVRVTTLADPSNTDSAQSSATSSADMFTYMPGVTLPRVPVLKVLSPSCGTTAGGTNVIIYGSNFAAGSGTTSVLFDTSSAPAVVSSGGLLAASAPRHDAGTVAVMVVAAGVASQNTLSYTYLDPCSTVAGGTGDDGGKLTSAHARSSHDPARDASTRQGGFGGHSDSVAVAPPGGTGAGPGTATVPVSASVPGSVPGIGSVHPSVVGLPQRRPEPAAPQEGYSIVRRMDPTAVPVIGLGAGGAGLATGCFVVAIRRLAGRRPRAAARRAYG